MSEETPDFFQSSSGPTDHFAIDDLLVDFSNDDNQNDAIPVPDPEANVPAVANSSNSSSFSSDGLVNFSGDISGSSDFSGDLCVPYDEWAELEWLSNFVEESFSSSDDAQRLQPIPGFKTRPDTQSESRNNSPKPDLNSNPIFTIDVFVPAKARSKRSRAAAAASIWASRGLQVINPAPNTNSNSRDDSFTHESTISVPAASHPQLQKKSGGSRKKEGSSSSSGDGGEEGRRCLHCATDKTPQWRTGPMGPKTLCNACGVRYKSGRLVPEYRPAASPTFVLTKHSNSHRKVMELRRQKEMIMAQQQCLDHHHHPTANMIFDVSSDGDDYLIHQNAGPYFQQLI